MKKTLAFLLAMILVVAVLAACGESASTVYDPSVDPENTDPTVEKGPDTPIDPGLLAELNGKELAKLMLAQERLNASILRNSDNIFSSGETVLANLAAVAAANLVYAEGSGDALYLEKSEEKVYKPSAGSTLTVLGDTYTWSDLPAYSNSYSYFRNLTNNIITTSKQGADMIDTFKKNVRVVGKWVKIGSQSLLLLVDENSETLVERHESGDTSGVYVTRRYKNADGQNVYEIYSEEKSPGFECYTRFFYIPDLRCEYVHHSLTDGSYYFDHNFYANKEKGFWEVFDVNGRKSDHINFSYMALKDDIFYDIVLQVFEDSVEPAIVKIMTPDRMYDLGMIMLGHNMVIELGLQSYEGVENLQAEIPKDAIHLGENNYDKPIIFFEDQGILVNHSGEYPAHINLTSGKTLTIGDSFVNGNVTIENIYVEVTYTDIGDAMHVAKTMISISGEGYDEQMANYKAFLLETGLTPKNSTPDYVINGALRAMDEVLQLVKWGTWNGASVSNEKELRQGFLTEDKYEADFYALLDSLTEIETIDGSDQTAIELNIKFSPVALGKEIVATYQNGVVTVDKVSLTASDTLLFVEGGQYVITLAMISTDENDTEGLIHVSELSTVGTVYAKAESFSVVQENISFNIPKLSVGKYTVVAYIATDDGIRTSQYIPITFTEVATESKAFERMEASAAKDASGAIVFEYVERLDSHIIRPIAEETLAYTALYEDLAYAVLKTGIIPEGAVVEVFTPETETWTPLAEGVEEVASGQYRLAYDATNGEISQKGYVIIELVYSPTVDEGEETPAGPTVTEDEETPVDPNAKLSGE